MWCCCCRSLVLLLVNWCSFVFLVCWCVVRIRLVCCLIIGCWKSCRSWRKFR